MYNLIDLFSGIGGFSLGLMNAGLPIKQHYFSEVDKYAIANYQYNFKNSIYAGPVENVQPIPGKSIVTFGSPCQDFSLAGKRKGMGGQRSSLIRHAITYITKQRPSVFVWENVKGAFSSNNGADFWAIIQAFANIGGYRLEWQLLNTSWLLPQNRARIYLIGHLAGKSKSEVFPIKESDFRAVETQGNTQGKRERVWGYHSQANCLTRQSRASNLIQVKAVLTSNRKETRQNGRRFKENGEPSFTLTGQDQHGVQINETIRRLTEIECERLQGFPDDWTKYGMFDGVKKEIAKTQRYKMCGNAVSVQVVQMVGERILKGLKL